MILRGQSYSQFLRFNKTKSHACRILTGLALLQSHQVKRTQQKCITSIGTIIMFSNNELYKVWNDELII